MSDTHTSDPAGSSLTASPGELLWKEREAQGLSLAEVASALNLRPAVVRGLETDSYEEVPIAAYRRGYLRAYAQLLGLDPQGVLEAYRIRFGGEEEQERRITPVHVTRPPSRIGAWLFRLVTLLVVAGLIGLTLLWWQSRGGNEPPDIGDSGPVSVDNLDGTTATIDTQPPAATPPEADATPPQPAGTPEVAETTEGAGDAEAAADDATPRVDPGPAHIVAAAASQAGAGAGQEDEAEAAAEEEAESAADPHRLELTFNEQSWTEIFDGNNQRIFMGLQEPGTSASVEGEPPFRLTVGNATGVELIWAGERVDLRARAGANNVARFTLGE